MIKKDGTEGKRMGPKPKVIPGKRMNIYIHTEHVIFCAVLAKHNMLSDELNKMISRYRGMS